MRASSVGTDRRRQRRRRRHVRRGGRNRFAARERLPPAKRLRAAAIIVAEALARELPFADVDSDAERDPCGSSPGAILLIGFREIGREDGRLTWFQRALGIVRPLPLVCSVIVDVPEGADFDRPLPGLTQGRALIFVFVFFCIFFSKKEKKIKQSKSKKQNQHVPRCRLWA